jgi:DNA (cytosine-5)-methyltransferase 1
MISRDYSNKTRVELVECCKDRGIKGYSGQTKAFILDLLSKSDEKKGVTLEPLLSTSSIRKDITQETDSIDVLLNKIILCEKIETIELYKKLCLIKKIDHSKGVYYTPQTFFKDILNKISLTIDNTTKTLDFCCGTGNLFISYLDTLKTQYNENIIKNIILNSLFLDIDETAITIFKLKLYCWIQNNLNIVINIQDYINNFRVNDGLLDVSSLQTKYNVILSNSPFINLKINVDYKKKIKDLKYYQYSTTGMMDTYIVAIERVLNLLDSDGCCIIICPSQILTNISSFNIRKHMIDTFSINNVFKFSEKNSIFPEITQSICVFDITKNTKNNLIKYSNCEYNENAIVINTTTTINKEIYTRNNYNIIHMTENDLEFISKLSVFPKIQDYPTTNIKCTRGNIDVSINKEEILSEKTPYLLVRGRNIKSLDTITEYISKETIDKKNINITNKKLVCQQICNINSANRLDFTVIDSTFIISNSCNYIILYDDKHIGNLTHILNSIILNRYFTMFSGNNHVSINEINNFPLPNIFENRIDLDALTPDEREIKIGELYNIDHSFMYKYFGSKSAKKITIYDHISQKLSAFESNIEPYIKPGGNWKDIPLSITTSERLNTIRKTGGRTTLYGRLDYCKPGFTITTQFARLPNSSNLHPTKHRMITIREAAILQSFPFDFKFSTHTQSAITQIGNAVPPLLARFIANYIKNDITNKNTLDLFSGVGGMSIGFVQEGFKILLSNELDSKLANENENSKYHTNNMYVCGNICDAKIDNEIKSKLQGIDIGVIIGGPPCQGFSLAGKRDSEDKRNKLYIYYFKMIETYKPECFVMENVKGILSMKNENGQLVIDEIQNISHQLGYKVSILKLDASDFGVPQKRERVFVIGHKHKLFNQPAPTIKKNVSVKDAIHFLEPFEENIEFEIDENRLNSPYLRYLSGAISLQELYISYS